MAGGHRPPLLPINERHVMNKTMLFVTALLLSAMPYAITQSISDGSWTTATLSQGVWAPPQVADWDPKRRALISETSKTLNSITVLYKNEEHKVTISLAGLSSITSVEIPQNSKYARIRIPNGYINIGLSGGLHHYIREPYLYVDRFIEVPEKSRMVLGENHPQQFETLFTQRDHIYVPVIKKYARPVACAHVRYVITWNVLSVSAERTHDMVTITFTIDPETCDLWKR